MGVALTEEEAWESVATASTGILTTLRRDGWPLALPVWFVVIGREVFVRSSASSRKVGRIRNDPRASFLVEGGRRWRELRAVAFTVHASIVTDQDLRAEALGALADKYGERRESRSSLPDATVRHYQRGGNEIIRLAPTGPPISWDNSRIRLSE